MAGPTRTASRDSDGGESRIGSKSRKRTKENATRGWPFLGCDYLGCSGRFWELGGSGEATSPATAAWVLFLGILGLAVAGYTLAKDTNARRGVRRMRMRKVVFCLSPWGGGGYARIYSRYSV